MTTQQAKKLKVGDRVLWFGGTLDKGVVTSVRDGWLQITWQMGDKSSIDFRDMQSVEREAI